MAFHRKALSLPRPNPKSGGNKAFRGLKSRDREGGTLHIEKALSRFVFGLRNFHNRITVKNIAGVTPRGVCISDSVVCCEDTCILISTLYGVSIYLNVVVSLSVYR